MAPWLSPTQRSIQRYLRVSFLVKVAAVVAFLLVLTSMGVLN